MNSFTADFYFEPAADSADEPDFDAGPQAVAQHQLPAVEHIERRLARLVR
jgi:hypothetical protein